MSLPSGFSGGFGVATLAASLQCGNLEAPASRHRTGRVLALERIKGRADHVVGVRRTLRLRNNVVHAERLEDRAHRDRRR